MSVSPTVSHTVPQGPGVRRVRHQARDVVAVMAFSAGTSVGLALVMTLVAGLSGAGR
jgi:hypothetical protein